VTGIYREWPEFKGLDSRLRGNDDSEVTRNSKKKTKPNEPDSRFYGNDGISVSVRTNLDSRLRGNDGILDCGYLSGMAI
ncbi:TPA: hypothetical protein ACKLRW_001279, partial [Neisseria gonorrhoeae]